MRDVGVEDSGSGETLRQREVDVLAHRTAGYPLGLRGELAYLRLGQERGREGGPELVPP